MSEADMSESNGDGIFDEPPTVEATYTPADTSEFVQVYQPAEQVGELDPVPEPYPRTPPSEAEPVAVEGTPPALPPSLDAAAE